MPFDGFAFGLILCLVVLVVLFGVTTGYADVTDVPKQQFEVFSNIHVMAFVGFGVLMSFSANLGMTALAHSLVLGSVAALWYILNRGLWEQAIGGVRSPNFQTVLLGRDSLVRADFAVSSVLIAFGALIGRVTALQALLLVVIHIVFYSLNESIGEKKIHMNDPGGSMTIHLFGALFGVTCAFVLDRQAGRAKIEGSAVTTPTSNVRALLGTLFLFCYWPSFNCYFSVATPSANAVQFPICFVNTYLALLSSAFISVLCSRVFNSNRTLVADLQNSVLAGGVVIGATSNVYVFPFGAIAIGAVAAFVALIGINIISPALQRMGVRDTCAVLSLHGIPGFVGGLIAIITVAASIIRTNPYPTEVWPGFAEPFTLSQSRMSAFQLAYLLLTILMAIVGGALAGVLMRLAPSLKRFYTDNEEWTI